ncbi:MAG: hypothetical protein HY736_04700, partial [Verrucomicrobia bacterium]|nr:hypothetical protein [Verrucomicrobiota bacterium]
KADDLLARLQAADTLRLRSLAHGDVAALWHQARQLDVAGIIDRELLVTGRRYAQRSLGAAIPWQAPSKNAGLTVGQTLKKNFLAGLELPDLTALNAAARVWLDTVANVRLHGETHRTPMAMFAEEQSKPRPLPPYPYDAAAVATVRVSNRGRVTVDTNRYSVPAAYASGQLTLKLYAERLRLFDGEKLVTEHRRCYERYQDRAHPEHAAALLHDRQQAREQQLLLQFLRLSPQAQAYHEQLVERRLPEPGALHLTRQSDLLELELPAPDLSFYEPKSSQP